MASPREIDDTMAAHTFDAGADQRADGASLVQREGSGAVTSKGDGRQLAQRRAVGVKRSAWAVWWLSGLTFGIYYLVWYYKINAELRAFAPEAIIVSPAKATWAQILPIFAWVSLAHTSARLNEAHRAIGSPVRVSGGVSILGTLWFNSQTRYLQRRMNSLWDAQDTLTAHRY